MGVPADAGAAADSRRYGVAAQPDCDVLTASHKDVGHEGHKDHGYSPGRAEYQLRERTFSSFRRVRISTRRRPSNDEASKEMTYWWRSSSTSRAIPAATSFGLSAGKKSPPVACASSASTLRRGAVTRSFGPIVSLAASENTYTGTSMVLAMYATSSGV